MVDYYNTQTTAAQLTALDHKRFMDRERQARHRKSKAEPVTRDKPRDITPDGTRDAKARTGQARTGLDESTDEREFADDEHSFSDRLAADFHPNDGHDARLTASARERWEAGFDD